MASFNVVSSLMPLASGSAPQTYRWALGLGILIPVVAGALGFLAFAFVAAALVVPAVYVVYMYDVNQWEDQPVGVVLGAIGAAAALAVGFTFLWHAGILGDDLAPVDIDGTESGIRWTSFLVLVLLVPIVGEVLKQVGPILLARLPAFDDMIDGLTFGVAAGAAFAAAETIVVNRGLFSTFGQVDSPDAGFWVSLILSAAVVKPIVYGAATGIAVASFSGLGAGYDGFKPGYFRGLAEALAANILFQGGLFFAARLEGTKGAVVGLVWGALIAAALVVRLRYLLHYAVLEAALEAASTGAGLKDAARGTAYCPSCEMPLMAGANFCVACGTSVRAGSKVTRARNRSEDADPATAKPSLRPTPAGVAPQDNKKTALVVGAIVGAILIGGALGQVAAGAAADEGDNLKPPSETPITIDPQSGEDELSKTSAIRLGAARRGRQDVRGRRRQGRHRLAQRRRAVPGAQGLQDRGPGAGLRAGLRLQGLLLRLPDAEEDHAAQADHQQPHRHPEPRRRGPEDHPAGVRRRSPASPARPPSTSRGCSPPSRAGASRSRGSPTTSSARTAPAPRRSVSTARARSSPSPSC